MTDYCGLGVCYYHHGWFLDEQQPRYCMLSPGMLISVKAYTAVFACPPLRPSRSSSSRLLRRLLSRGTSFLLMLPLAVLSRSSCVQDVCTHMNLPNCSLTSLL